jgi:type IV secretory pathway VirB2 component (pilin)
MRESLQRWRGPWRFNNPSIQRSTNIAERMRHAAGLSVQVSRIAVLLIVSALVLPTTVLAQQSPWERAASNLEQTFTGPLARSLALVAIVIGGLMFMFGEAGAKRQISGIVFGGGLALFAAQFLTWLF